MGKKLKKIGVLTSGGDAPGMNAAIRAVVRTGIYLNREVIGIHRGYQGIINQEFSIMSLASVANIIQRGGTVLKTARCPDFHKKNVRSACIKTLKAYGIDGLVIIGGDGSYAGAHKLWIEHKYPVVGVPGTIDNDIYGTEATIGYDTAINTGLRAIDQIRDTANSHDRIFLVEVMGRNSGYIAMDVGIGGGAQAIVIPEKPINSQTIAAKIKRGQDRGKMSSIIVIAEGKKAGKSFRIAENLKNNYNLACRVVVLGHVQRGGSPTARDRKIASVLGGYAARALINGESDIAVGIECQDVSVTRLTDAIRKKKHFHQDLLQLTEVLAT